MYKCFFAIHDIYVKHGIKCNEMNKTGQKMLHLVFNRSYFVRLMKSFVSLDYVCVDIGRFT